MTTTAVRAARLLTSLAATGALLLPTLPAAASGGEPVLRTAAETSFTVPAAGSFVIRGHGYGHGHGMSQYGAQGAARQGVGWKKILNFYYPGTRRADYGARVRVHISADTSRRLLVEPRAGLRVRALGKKKTRHLPAKVAGKKVKRWRLTIDKSGRSVVAHRSGGAWHRWWRFAGQGDFRAAGKPITLRLPGGATARYRGRLTLAGAARDTVNSLSLENYIKGVVPKEVPATWHPDAVRAQAVAARTYAAYERRHPKAGHYQLCDTAACQVYGGVDAEHPASNKAIKATRRVILTHGGTPAFTQFSASSGGWTAANQFSYLPTQQDPWDDWAGNPVHTWQVTISRAAVETAWPGIGRLQRINVKARSGDGAWGGRVRTLVLIGSKGRVQVTGDAFRYALGLRSNWFTFRSR